MRLFTQRVVRDVRLRAEVWERRDSRLCTVTGDLRRAGSRLLKRMTLTYARATLVVKVAEAGEAFFAASTGDQVALAALREHALAHDASADRFVAGLGVVPRHQQK